MYTRGTGGRLRGTARWCCAVLAVGLVAPAGASAGFVGNTSGGAVYVDGTVVASGGQSAYDGGQDEVKVSTEFGHPAGDRVICTVKVRPGGRVDIDAVRSPVPSAPPVFRCSSSTRDPQDPARFHLLDRDPYVSGDTPAQRDVRFLATADPQFWRTEDDQSVISRRNPTAEDTLNVMNDWLRDGSRRLRGALVAGDLTQNSRLDEWMIYRSTIEDPVNARTAARSRENPVWVDIPYGTINRLWYDTVGNHDFETRLNSTEPDHFNEHRCELERVDCQSPVAIERELERRFRTTRIDRSDDAAGLYSWDWHDVHFISAGLSAGDAALPFIRDDLAGKVGTSGRPVVLMAHYGFDTDDWTESERVRLWNALRPYNVVAFLAGHLHYKPRSDSWLGRFDNPRGGVATKGTRGATTACVTAAADGSCATNERQPACDVRARNALSERECIPTYTVGAAMFDPPDDVTPAAEQRGSFVQISITATDCGPTASDPGAQGQPGFRARTVVPGDGQACMVVRRYMAEDHNDGDADDVDAVEVSSDLQLIDVVADTEPPFAEPTTDPADAAERWTRGLTVAWNWRDALSGIDPSCPTGQDILQEGEIDGATVQSTCRDKLGHEGSASLAGRRFRVDRTSPTLTATPPSGSWRNGDLEVRLDWVDTLSGLSASCPRTVDVDAGTETVQVECDDEAGNRRKGTLTYGLDDSPPVPVIKVTPPANAAGWHRTDAHLRWTWSSLDSSLRGAPIDQSACDTDRTTTGEGIFAETARCRDRAGNSAMTTTTVRIDRTAPTMRPSDVPVPNASGWFSGPVEVRWACADTGSGPVRDEVVASVGEEGENREVTGTCADVAGNVSSATEGGFDIDRSPPEVAIDPALDGATFDFEEPVTATYACTDQPGLSGIASCDGDAPSGGRLDTARAGERTFTVTAVDRSGHRTTRTIAYTVRPAPTRLTAMPGLVRIGRVGFDVRPAEVVAGLDYGTQRRPAAGRTVSFVSGSTALCSAVTGRDGVARCSYPPGVATVEMLRSGVTARFAGDRDLLPSTDSATALGATLTLGF